MRRIPTKTIATTIVTACTALMIVPVAQAADYGSAISGCKSAIYERVSGDKVSVSLGDVKKKGSKQVQLDFKVKVTTNSERTRMNARCLATLDGDVLNLTLR